MREVLLFAFSMYTVHIFMYVYRQQKSCERYISLYSYHARCTDACNFYLIFAYSQEKNRIVTARLRSGPEDVIHRRSSFKMLHALQLNSFLFKPHFLVLKSRNDDTDGLFEVTPRQTNGTTLK